MQDRATVLQLGSGSESNNRERLPLLLLIAVFAFALPLFAQSKPRIVTGNDAAKLFLFRGKPIHPFCLDLPQEGSSRPQPIDLAQCTETKVSPKKETYGWWSAEYPREEDDIHISLPPGISYGVLAKKDNKFLIASESSGGGSGQFTALFWVLLDEKQLSLVKDEMGGDRCIGRLEGYGVQKAAILVTQSTTPAGIFGLSGVKVDEAITNGLRGSYIDCAGAAIYRYDLASEKSELTSVKLNVPDPPEPTAAEPQACFDNLVRQYAKAKKTTVMKPPALKEFGQKFAVTCTPQELPGK